MKRETRDHDEVVPAFEERLTLEQYHDNARHGILGHAAKLLWVDPPDDRIPFARLFWDIFDSVAVTSPDSHTGDDYVDMQAELEAQHDQLPTMTAEKKQALLEAFVMWENVVNDYHTLEIGLKSRISESIAQFERNEPGEVPYKISPEEAMSQIEQILSYDYDFLFPDRVAASEALDKILNMAFFSGRSYKKIKTQ
jgi:hypothetical protein